jgi:aryl-alcohol dehydrogenase-like predicted oxidoreductase
MNFGEAWKGFMGHTPKEEAEKIFDYYVSNGGNFIDTANVYQNGESEQWLGEFITKRGNRDEVRNLL